LYFLGLSLRNTSRALEPLLERSYDFAIWYWMQKKFNSNDVFQDNEKSRITAAYIIDETTLQISCTNAWLWVAIEPIRHEFLEFIFQGTGIC
jgi:transposase-like protein